MELINSTHYPLLEDNIIKAKGIFVYNQDNKKFYDIESGVWCLPLGHNNDKVNETIINQLSKVTHVGYLYSTKVLEDARTKLCHYSGIKNSNCVFLSSGSEAVEFAIRIAKSL